MNTTDSLSAPPSLVDAARAVIPRIQAAGDQIERDRRLPPDLVAAMVEVGLFRMLVPQSLGGGEASLLTFSEVIETIAQADGSVAWCLSQAGGTSMSAAFLPHEHARAIFGDPNAILAWGPGTAGTVRPVPGGYRLSGQWPFASGGHHATWLGGRGPLIGDDGQPRIGPNGEPEGRLLLFPSHQAEFRDVWHVSGLRGTGSDTYVANDLFVPEAYAVSLPFQNPHEPGPLYLFSGGPSFNPAFAVGFSSVALGLARASLDALLALAQTKTPRGPGGVLREHAVVQSQVGECEATLRSARAFLRETVADIWEAVSRSGVLTLELRVLLRLATIHATQRAMQVLDVAYHAAGSTAILAGGPFERRFRDMHAVAQQVQSRRQHYETAGQFFLGLEPDLEWL